MKRPIVFRATIAGVVASLLAASAAFIVLRRSSDIPLHVPKLPATVDLASLGGQQVGSTGCTFAAAPGPNGMAGVGPSLGMACGETGRPSGGAVYVPQGAVFHDEEWKPGARCEPAEDEDRIDCRYVTPGVALTADGATREHAISRIEAMAQVIAQSSGGTQ